ncbi:hypothetical protein L7F22_069373 [Adiantum nelumboides]|nr:hypothetical protein [Adiantum nelumboides]
MGLSRMSTEICGFETGTKSVTGGTGGLIRSFGLFGPRTSTTPSSILFSVPLLPIVSFGSPTSGCLRLRATVDSSPLSLYIRALGLPFILSNLQNLFFCTGELKQTLTLRNMAEEADVFDAAVESRQPLEGSSGDMDERLATLVHLQQLQQKQEEVQRMKTETAENADAGFRRGLEELVRDHLNTCMALASCSSLDSGINNKSNSTCMSQTSSFTNLHDAAGGSLHGENHGLHAYDTASSHNGILDEYGTVQGCKSDAPVFEISDSAFCSVHHPIGEQDQPDFERGHSDSLEQEQGEVNGSLADNQTSVPERPRSNILSIWAAERAQEMITTMERQAREAELLALAGLHTVSTLDASFLRESLTTGDSSLTDSSGTGEERRQRRPSSRVQMWRELEERRSDRARHSFEQRGSDSSRFVHNADLSHSSTLVLSEEAQAVVSDGAQPQTEDSTDWEGHEAESHLHENVEPFESDSVRAQEGEREHVRQIVQRLMTENGVQDMSSDSNAHSRSSWLDENERERVRELAREWVRVTNEQRGIMHERGGQRLQRVTTSEHTNERHLTGQAESFNENAVQWRGRRDRRFLNRQAILDILMRAERDRQTELQLLVEHRAVSDFAHRQQLQSFLRGRFLRPGLVSEEERIPSSAAGELGQLRQRRAVSHLREGFRFRLESILRNQVNNRDTERTNTRSAMQRRRRRRNEDQPAVHSPGRDLPSRRGVPPPENFRGGWHVHFAPRRVAELQNTEESNEYNMELRELLGRRSVTNVLASDFRDRLDRLIRSFLQTQGRAPVAWDIARAETTQPQQQRRLRQQVQWQQLPAQPPVVPPPPPPPPPQPLWQPEMQQGLWQRPLPPLHRASYTDGESITELRADVLRLQQGMADLHRVMETCLEMQLDLQRSMRQELAGALQQMYEGKAIPEEAIDGSKWVSVKRGICCVCCDRNIDSLLYRCGHMCTCLSCASELIKKSGKCPMCRAPIKEVVRAFTVA